MSKDLVRKQFGLHASAYVTSQVHAKGASLSRLVDLVQPQPDWRVLDLATGAGHTALAMAPHVAHVLASDLTADMLSVAEDLARERGVTNISFEMADAEETPFAGGEFDLVTCRIAPHHFPHVDRFVLEAHRVLRAGGTFAVVDNVVPEGSAGDYVNRFEKLRDPSHHHALALDEWRQALEKAGFVVTNVEAAPKRMAFQPWAERMGAAEEMIVELRRMLESAPNEAADYFRAELDGDGLHFYLSEAIVISQKP